MTGPVMLIFDCTTDPGDLPPDLAREAEQIHRHCAEPECRVLPRARSAPRGDPRPLQTI